MFCNGIPHLCNFKPELTLTQIGFRIAKHSKKRVLQWIIAFVQMIVRVDTYTKLIFHCKTHKKMCFAMEYRICVISSQSWHLHKSDFPLQNTQKNVFCNRLLHLCKWKSELTLTQSWFFNVKCTKRCVLIGNTAFV